MYIANVAEQQVVKKIVLLSYCFLQADIATLMASLIGIPIPVNSVVSPKIN